MQSPWKTRVQEMLNICQEELKKTTEIGKKMISASKANSELHETYELLGQEILKDIRQNKINWENTEAIRLIKIIEQKEAMLESMESQVQDIKKKN